MKTYLHTFPDGNRCTLSIDWESERPVKAQWHRKPDWVALELEYKEWRNDCVRDQLRNSEESD